MSLKNWNFFREKSEFLRDISISLKTVVRRGLPNAYGRVTWKFLNIGLVLYIFFQLRGYLKYRPEYKSLLVCALLIGTFSAIANLTEWGWRYLDVTNFMFCSLYILILADSKVFGLKFDNVIRIASPFFVYIILFQLRGILEIIGINALCVGNVLTTWFIEDSCPVLSLIK